MIRAEQVDTDTIRALYRRIDQLEREIRELRASRRLESASIGGGGLRVKDGGSVTVDGGSVEISAGSMEISGGRLTVYDVDGMPLARLGDLGSGFRGTWLGRAGGEIAMAVYGTGPGRDAGFVGLYDRSGNYIVTDDAMSRRGLARPYLHMMVGEITPPTATTTSESFVDLAAGYTSVHHPVMHAYLLVRADDSTTAGEARLALNGEGIGPTLTIRAGSYAFEHIGPFKVPDPGDYASLKRLSVQARRTTGTGTIGVRVMSIIGLESSWLDDLESS